MLDRPARLEHPMAVGLGLGLNMAGGRGGGVVMPPLPVGAIEHYRLNQGITVTGAGVSQWDGAIGAHHLTMTTDANRPSKQLGGEIRFNGTTHRLNTAAWVQAQPITVCLLGKQITHTAFEAIFDTVPRMLLMQTGVSPQLELYAGTGFAAPNSNLTLDTYKGIICVFDGAGSLIHVEGSAPTTGNPGTGGIGQFFLGSDSSGTGQSNIEVKDIIIYDRALDATERQAVFDYWAAL